MKNFILGSSILFASSLAFANELHHESSVVSVRSALPHLVTELRAEYAPATYIAQALQNLRGVQFKELSGGTAAIYNHVTRIITFRPQLRDPSTGTLKKAVDLSYDELGTVYHELFHCYFSTVSQPKGDELFSRWKTNAQALYSSKGEEIHSEAYAVFIERTLSDYISTRRMMARMSPQVRENARKHPQTVAFYENGFSQSIHGYYYNSWQGQFVESPVNLPTEDRQNLLKNLYMGEMLTRFGEAFAEERFTGTPKDFFADSSMPNP